MNFDLRPSSDYKSNCSELNADLYNLLDVLNYQGADWANINKLSPSMSKHLSDNFEYKGKLLNSSILCVTPIFNSISDWESLFFGDVQKLSQQCSLAPLNISPALQTEIKYHNKFYLNHIISTAKSSPLASLELGVSQEIISLLRKVTVEQKNNAMRFKFAMFQWRYQAKFLTTDGKEFSEIEWLTHLIHSSPAKLISMPTTSDLAKRYHSEAAYPLAEHLVRYGMRATIITTFLPNLHPAKVREMYKRLLSESSSCGKLPSSFSWYFLTERRRSHCSFFLLLYRLAQKSGLPHIHSLIAAYGWYLVFAPEDPIAIDRLGILVNAVQSGSGTVYAAACRGCTSNYLLCNTEDKQEFAQQFHCMACVKKKLQPA